MTTYWIFWNDRVVFTGTSNPMPSEAQPRKHNRYNAADTEEIIYDFNVVANLPFYSDLIKHLIIGSAPNDEGMQAMLIENILFLNAQVPQQLQSSVSSSTRSDAPLASTSSSHSNGDDNQSDNSSEQSTEVEDSPTSSDSSGEISNFADDVTSAQAAAVGSPYLAQYVDEVSLHSTSTI